MDELMMDWLYEELDPARSARVAEHAGGCARCSAELAALRRTREAFREMPDLEPPPALSAILLHEAARRAPSAEAGAVVVAVSSDGDTGLWARIAAWLRPLALHPAATAACTIVLLAGVAGALYVRGDGEMAARTHMSSPDLPPPPPADGTPPLGGAPGGSEQADSTTIERNERGFEAELQKAPTAKPALEAQGPGGSLDGLVNEDAPASQADRQPSSYAADVLDDERQAGVLAAEGKAPAATTRAAQAQRENKDSSALRSKRKTAEKNRAQKGDVGVELDESRDLDDKARADLSKEVAPRRDYAAPPATASGTGGRAEDPAVPPIATGGEAGGTRGPSRGAPPKVSQPEPSRPADVSVAEPEAAAPPTAGASASTAPAEVRTKAQLAWLSAQEGKISTLTRSGKCREVAAAANDILDRDPSYYVSRVQAKVAAGKCQRLVGDEQRRRATRRASKKAGGSQRNVKAAPERSEAADAAEPSAESEKAQKK